MEGITIEVLRALLADAVLIGPKRQRQRLPMPSTLALSYLTVRLRDWRRRMAGMQAAAVLDKRRLAIRSRLIEAAADVAELKAAAPTGESPGLDGLAREIDRLARGRGLQPRCLWHDWRPYAAALAGEFVIALQFDNPGLRGFGIGHTGPVARYVAAVLPLITDGAAPSVQTVATFMQIERAHDPYRYRGVEGNRPPPLLNK